MSKHNNVSLISDLQICRSAELTYTVHKGDMEGLNTEFALYGRINGSTMTDTVFFPLSQISEGRFPLYFLYFSYFVIYRHKSYVS